jgi:hypothetical protein
VVSFEGDAPQTLSAIDVTPINAPDNSLSGLLSMIRSAKKTLDIQQMTFDPRWGKVADVSPLYTAVVAAARRGVQVRILLNDERVFDHPSHPSKPKNRVTFTQLNRLAQNEGLNLSVRIANLQAMGVDYIHNKGALIDGKFTLISSINWGENAVDNNREAAVLINGEQVNSHYQALFDQDWNASETAPEIFSEAQSHILAVSCPDVLDISAEIKELDLEGQEDADFHSISGKTIQGTFVRSKGENGSCVLNEKGKSSSVATRKFVEIRSGHGTVTVILEGYTPRTKKLYSIRAKLPSHSGYKGRWKAQVYEGAGSRKALGAAVMKLHATDQD